MVSADEYLPSIIDLSKGPWTKIILPCAPPGGQGEIQWVETSSGALIARVYSTETVDGSGQVNAQIMNIRAAYPLGPVGTRPALTSQQIAISSSLTGSDNGSTGLTLTTQEGSAPGAQAGHAMIASISPTLRGATGFSKTIIDALGQSSFLQWMGAANKSNLAVQIGAIPSLAIVAGNHAVSIPLARAWSTVHSFFAAFITAAPTDVSNVFSVGVQDLSNGTMKINTSVSQNISVAYLSIGN